MSSAITNDIDVIDSRDIIERITELERNTEDEIITLIDDEDWAAIDDIDNDELSELVELKKLASQCEGVGDWEYGGLLIRRSYWIAYVEELLRDIGDLPANIPWYIEIDWETTARNIEMDYTSVDFGDVEYLIRM